MTSSNSREFFWPKLWFSVFAVALVLAAISNFMVRRDTKARLEALEREHTKETRHGIR